MVWPGIFYDRWSWSKIKKRYTRKCCPELRVCVCKEFESLNRLRRKTVDGWKEKRGESADERKLPGEKSNLLLLGHEGDSSRANGIFDCTIDEVEIEGVCLSRPVPPKRECQKKTKFVSRPPTGLRERRKWWNTHRLPIPSAAAAPIFPRMKDTTRRGNFVTRGIQQQQQQHMWTVSGGPNLSLTFARPIECSPWHIRPDGKEGLQGSYLFTQGQ